MANTPKAIDPPAVQNAPPLTEAEKAKEAARLLEVIRLKEAAALGETARLAYIEQAKRAMYWAFTYDGPILATDDRGCDHCNAASMKKCPKGPTQHGPHPAGCSTCYAARVGYCPNHCGIQRALGEHGNDHAIHDDHLSAFDVATKVIIDYAKGVKDGARVTVKAHAHQDQPDAPFAALTIEVTVSK
jgi:hypothetical protein